MIRLLRRAGAVVLWLAVAACAAVAIVPAFLDRIYYQGPVSAHFNGGHFFNPDREDTVALPGGARSNTHFALRWLSGSYERAPWPDHVAVTPGKPAARVDGDRMVVTWIGHATVLVQTQGLNILTDPIYADRAGPFGFGPRRVAEPGVRFDDLPRIDLVVVSHDHYDHMDLATLRRLWQRDHPRIVTSLGNDTVIAGGGARATALDWGGRLSLRPGIDVIVTRNHHWGSRWGKDRNRALWSSFVVTLPRGNLFFAGDTGWGDGLWPAEARALGPIRLALVPIGAFRFMPGQMSNASHIGPVDAAEVTARLGAAHGIAVHWGTFRLSSEAYDTPRTLLGAVNACRHEDVLHTAVIGAPVEIAPYAPPATHAQDRAAVLKCLDTPAVRAMK